MVCIRGLVLGDRGAKAKPPPGTPDRGPSTEVHNGFQIRSGQAVLQADSHCGQSPRKERRRRGMGTTCAGMKSVGQTPSVPRQPLRLAFRWGRVF